MEPPASRSCHLTPTLPFVRIFLLFQPPRWSSLPLKPFHYLSSKKDQPWARCDARRGQSAPRSPRCGKVILSPSGPGAILAPARTSLDFRPRNSTSPPPSRAGRWVGGQWEVGGRRWKPGGKSSVEKQPPARQHLLLPLSEPFSSFDSSLQLTPTNEFDSCRCCQLKTIVSLELIRRVWRRLVARISPQEITLYGPIWTITLVGRWGGVIFFCIISLGWFL